MLKTTFGRNTARSRVARSRMLVYGVAIVSARGYRDHGVFLRFIPGLSSSVAAEYFQEESSCTLCLRPCVGLKENRMSRRNGDRSRRGGPYGNCDQSGCGTVV